MADRQTMIDNRIVLMMLLDSRESYESAWVDRATWSRLLDWECVNSPEWRGRSSTSYGSVVFREDRREMLKQSR